MLENYLKLALRNLSKNRLFSFLNIVGLAFGMAACLLIALFVTHELSYDRWNPLAERIVRPVSDIRFGSADYKIAVVSALLGPDCARELPEVQAACRFRDYGSYLIKRDGEGQQNFKEQAVLTVDSSFFEIFPLRILEGDPARCLSRPKTMALSRKKAEKYFSAPQLAIGQTLVLENEERWTVTAVYEDLPGTNHFEADFLLSMNGNDEVKNAPPVWGANMNWHTYLLLREGVDKKSFEKKFTDFARQKLTLTIQGLLGVSMEDFEKTGQFARYPLQNLTDIHLHSDLNVELAANGSIKYVWVFSSIAAFILLIACINFMNLSTARSTNRAREVGVRKSLGGDRKSLVGQFLTESTLLALFSVLLAVLIAAAAMPWYRDLTGRALSIPWFSPSFWGSLLGFSVAVGFFAGSYPAFFLSAFNAIKVLKGEVTGGLKGAGMRSALVVFQFSISVALIVSTLLVLRQLNYIQNKKLGFVKDQVLILDDAYALDEKTDAFKQEVLRLPGVHSATVSGFLPVRSGRNDQTFTKSRVMDVENSVGMQHWRVDADYIPTMGMELVAGRNFDPNRPADSSAVLLNEAAAKLFGFQGVPNGWKVYTLNDFEGKAPAPEDFVEYEVIGVIKDFHWSSLRDEIGPVSMKLGRSRGNISMRYEAGQTEALVNAVKKLWETTAPGQPFNHRFMNASFDQMYRAERRIAKIGSVFAGLSVLISCLGLFGLAAYTTERRTKEIGIRKVLGASVSGITALLAGDFLKLVAIAILIATPIAWYFSREWLSDFAFRVDISWKTFALAGFVALSIAFLTISFQTVKTALHNPVKSLRNE